MAIHWVADRDVSDRAAQRWRNGPAGFGYGHDERTKLSDMKGNYDSLYLRRDITIPEDTSANGRLVLALQYSDGFVAFLAVHASSHGWRTLRETRSVIWSKKDPQNLRLEWFVYI